MRILVVDDEPMVQFMLQQFLTDEGHDVDVACNGRSAWDLLQHNRYDLVLTDVHMPYMSGDTLIKRLHQANICVPVVVMDSYPDALTETLPADRVFAVLAKPFDLDEVRQVLQRLEYVLVRR